MFSPVSGNELLFSPLDEGGGGGAKIRVYVVYHGLWDRIMLG